MNATFAEIWLMVATMQKLATYHLGQRDRTAAFDQHEQYAADCRIAAIMLSEYAAIRKELP